MRQEKKLAAWDKQAASKVECETACPHPHSNSSISSAARQSGFVKVPIWLLRKKRISVPARLLLIDLLSYAQNGSVCWPAQKTLASDLGVGTRSIRRHLAELENLGLIKIEKRPGTSNCYHMCFETDGYTRRGKDRMSTGGRPYLSDTQDRETPELILTDKTTKNNENIEVVVNKSSPEVSCELEKFGVFEPTRSGIASLPHVDVEYVKKHILYALKKGDRIGLAIHRMKCADDAPDFCLECEGIDGKHVLDCVIHINRYVEGAYADFWLD